MFDLKSMLAPFMPALKAVSDDIVREFKITRLALVTATYEAAGKSDPMEKASKVIDNAATTIDAEKKA